MKTKFAFLLLSLTAAGWSKTPVILSTAAGSIAKICFVIFLVLFLVSLITGRRGAV